MVLKLNYKYVLRIQKNSALYLCSILRSFVKKIQLLFDIINIKTIPICFFFIILFLKKHSLCQYKILIDIIIVDFIGKKYRFNLHYNFLSIIYNMRLYLTIKLTELLPINVSIISMHKTALWLEREAFDMFGIYFFKNNNLKRLLTDYGFVGYPFRKDFPLYGFIEIFYNDLKKKIEYKNVSLTQDFRYFKLNNKLCH